MACLYIRATSLAIKSLSIMDIYHNKYRPDSVRLQEWDYASDGYYFITICTKEKKCTLGTIHNNEIQLSEIGEIANQYLLEIPAHFPRTKTDVCVVMPNHVHAILIIEDSVETRHGVSLEDPAPTKNEFSKPISGSLPVIINQYKSSVKRWCNKNDHSDFEWQKLYYEHIIRDGKELYNIRKYVCYNHLNWEADKLHTTD